ncbi:hypothetical protein Prudu_001905 [Prunus dulcis]|uniref:Uncharacterized protein n=1 Tax=Prunus dulcis TaxID=3755 RepID=A0A4Y1QPP3_PRUDU|nr:hypothetical protein Prudu_001905 [Prunus dulcis]
MLDRSAGRAGKPIVKWTENRAQELPNVFKISLSNREFTLRIRHSQVLKYLKKKIPETYQSWNLRQGDQKMGHG